MNLFPIERHCLALIFASQKHYLLAHHLNLVTKFNPLKYLLPWSKHIAWWLLQLNKSNMSSVAHRGLGVKVCSIC